jgi:hypothetical protein
MVSVKQAVSRSANESLRRITMDSRGEQDGRGRQFSLVCLNAE